MPPPIIPLPGVGVLTEDVGVVGGFLTATGDVNYSQGSDTGQWTAATLSGAYGELVIDANGVWSYSVDNADPSIQALNSGETITEVFTVSSRRGPTTITITINGADEPPCFTRGTPIETPEGPRAVESLRPGDRVLTVDNGAQPIRWIGSRKIALDGGPDTETLRPVRLRADSIAPGVPIRDILVSPMHRILIDGARSQLLFGVDEVLVPAKHLVNGRTIFTDPAREVEYFHLLFDSHQILIAMNLKSESFYPGGVGLGGFDDGARDELLRLFPELRGVGGAYGPTARKVLRRHESRLVRAVLSPPSNLAEALLARAS